ncbi:MAG: DNA polymerase III subunit beta [Kiritimatiellae bacterium]|nr:DNA polymerase III subunit beta [Kiritimatiellia bacterium]
MKFTVSKADLLDALQTVLPAIATRSTIPVLSNVLLECRGQALTLTGSDMRLTIRAIVPAVVSEEGATTLDAKRLLPIVREMPGAEIQITTDERQSTTLVSESVRFRLNGITADDFPLTPKLDGAVSCTLDRRALRGMLQRTVYATSKDESREVLTGVLIEISESRVTAVATDGRRMALVEQEVDDGRKSASLIVPTRTAVEMVNILEGDGPVTLMSVGRQMALDCGNVLLFSALIEGKFPNYRQVVPKQSGVRVTLSREAFLNALRRVSLVTSEVSNSVQLRFSDGQMEVYCETPEIGEAKETVPVQYSGAPLAIPFNPDFLMDPLKTLVSDQVYFEISDVDTPGVLKADEAFLYVIMPLRLT